MSTTFAFGKSGIEVPAPDNYDCAVIASRDVKPLDDAYGALQHALDHPLASAPIGDLAKGKKSIAIVVCDITRPAPNSITLPPLLDRLHIPFFAFALGAIVNLKLVWKAGMALGISVLILSAFFLAIADLLTGGKGTAGIAASTTAGNAAAVPALVAAANPKYAAAAAPATVLVACSVMTVIHT